MIYITGVGKNLALWSGSFFMSVFRDNVFDIVIVDCETKKYVIFWKEGERIK